MSEQAVSKENDEVVQPEEHRIPQTDKITNKDLMKSWFGWWWTNEIPHTFDRMLAPASCFGLIPTLKNYIKIRQNWRKHFNGTCCSSTREQPGAVGP